MKTIAWIVRASTWALLVFSLALVSNPVSAAAPSGTGTSLPYLRPAPMIWGVNGHPNMQEAYTGNVAAQLADVKRLGATYYRVDVTRERFGTPALGQLFASAASAGVRILPVLTDSPDMEKTPSDNYKRGWDIGLAFATSYAQHITHIELGNEVDNKCILSDKVDGWELAHYDPAKLEKAIAFLDGMADAVRSRAPSVKIIIDIAYRHVAFIEAVAKAGVPFDIIGWHWYANMANRPGVLERLESDVRAYGKTGIWMTETGDQRGSTDREQEYAQEAYDFTVEYYRHPLITGHFYYELYDQPANTREPDYGLIHCADRRCTSRSDKLAYEWYGYAIEEQDHGYEDYVYWLYARINRRLPSSAELAQWTNSFKTAQNKSTLLSSFLPEESYLLFVREQYLALLDRTADSSGSTYWTNQMRNGLSRRDLIIKFCAGDEFWNLSGRTNEGFVKRLYQKLLRRPADASGLAYWTGQLNSGVSRTTLAARFVDGVDYQTLFVGDQFLEIFGRTADPAARDYFVNRMQDGMTQEGLRQALLLSGEFWVHAIEAGYDRRH
jgi:hypothetical protein